MALQLVGWLPRLAQAQVVIANDQTVEGLTWTTESTGPRRFVAVHGQQALISGYSKGGLEIWAYPLQIVNAYTVNYRPEGATTEVDGLAVLRRITYGPESVTRIYVGPDVIVREKLFVPSSVFVISQAVLQSLLTLPVVAGRIVPFRSKAVALEYAQ